MTYRMHLRARAPNEGARRLAQYLSRPLSKRARLRLRAICSDALLCRFVGGELLPSNEMSAALELATHGLVRGADWSRPAVGWWFDTVPVRVRTMAA